MIEAREQAVLGFSHCNFTEADSMNPVIKARKITESASDRQREAPQSQSRSNDASVGWEQPSMAANDGSWGNG